MVSASGFLCKRLQLFAAFLWVSASTLFLALSSLFIRTIFRDKAIGSSATNKAECEEPDSGCIKQKESDLSCMQQEESDLICVKQDESVAAEELELCVPKVEETEGDDELQENEEPKFFFKFHYQTYKENLEPVAIDPVLSTTASKYECLPEQDLNHVLEEPQAINLTVKELFACSSEDAISEDEITNTDFKPSGKTLVRIVELESNPELEEIQKAARSNNFSDLACKDEVEMENIVDVAPVVESPYHDKAKAVQVEHSDSDAHFMSEELDASDSDSDSLNSSREFMSRFMASTTDGFLSDKDFEDELELDALRNIIGERIQLDEQDLELEETSIDGEDSDLMEELERLEEPDMQNSGDTGCANQELSSSNNKDENGSDSCEDSNGLESLWEHQDFIEQLEMDLKKARATGLPTIFEEDECPKIIEDFKPWIIDEKLHNEDRMGSLHKFHKSYRERMRKFDILNYQKMYAKSFLQSKDPLSSSAIYTKASSAALTSLLSQKLSIGRRKKSMVDPMAIYMRELHSDLEMVYVGQMCLSWEILNWQYQKALELWESDQHGVRCYNEVAGELQQFQVLVQRFIENEPFQGPRVENYAKNRCALRNLLQVPLIREDGGKGKRARRKGKDKYTITSDKLVEIMEETIRICWRFVRADKDSHIVVQKSRKGTQIEPQDPEELELLTEVRTTLQKKDKKLKEILRSGNCILRKFQRKHQDDDDNNSDQALYFFSQVDMKMVTRVLNMSKITKEQLLWCHNKLSKISFVSHKLHVEPSFFLFPC